MLNEIRKHLHTNIARYTNIFNLSSENVQLTLNKNVVNTQLVGEYTLTDTQEHTHFSKMCIEQTFNFIDNKAEADCFFSKEDLQMQAVAKKINIGTAINTDIAERTLLEQSSNFIIVALGNMQAKKQYKGDTYSTITYNISIFTRVGKTEVENLGCKTIDMLFLNSMADYPKCKELNFLGIGNRYYADNSMILEYLFTVTEKLDFSDIILNQLKSFDYNLEIGVNQ